MSWSEEEDDDRLLSEAADAIERQLAHQEQLGGSLSASDQGRFEFTLNPYVDRQSRAMGVRERHYLTNVRQVGRFVPRQHLAAALRDGLHRALQNLILRERIAEQDRVYFSLSSNLLNNSYDYRGLPASEWMNGSDRVDSMLQQMSRMLNSNENFEMDDSFQLSFTHVRKAPSGSGKKRKMKPGHSKPETFKRFKESVVTIKNNDELCCARAIMAAKAKVDCHPNWDGFKKGRKYRLSKLLLSIKKLVYPLVRVDTTSSKSLPWRPLSMTTNYYLLTPREVIASNRLDHPRTNRWFFSTTMITTFPGFFGSSYFCARCFKPYDNEGRHACKNNPDHCPACLQTGCPDYTEAKCRGHRATTPCGSCKHLFHGATCLQNHLSKSYNGKAADAKNVSLCSQRRKCVGCQKLLVGMKAQKEHECGHAECPSCREYVDVATHKCFIQVVKSPEEEKQEKTKKS